MLAILLGAVFVDNSLYASLPKENNKAILLFFENAKSKQNADFYGSIDKNIDGKICLYHTPTGEIKPAIVLIHPLIFKNANQKKKIEKLFGKNVLIRGEIVQRNGSEYILVEELDAIILEP